MTDFKSNAIPDGYTRYQRNVGYLRTFELFVPTDLKQKLVDEDRHREAEVQAREKEAQEKKESEDASDQEMDKKEQDDLVAKPAIAIAVDKFKPQIYCLNTVAAARAQLKINTSDTDRLKQGKLLYDKMYQLGGHRMMAQPRKTWSAQLDQLAMNYPNFRQVVEYLRAEFTLRKAARKPLGFAPFAVYGPPGIGKSVFMEALRELLGSDFRRIQAETSQHAAAIVGTAKHWGNAEAGAVFDRLVFGPHANPLIYVDEIDKVEQERSGSIISAMYGLLEPQSAKAFSDTSQPDIPLDASHIQWVFSANEIQYVPAAVRSRWVEFKIPPLKAAEARRVVQLIYARLLKEYSVKGLEPLSDADLDALSMKSPREMISLLRQALAKSILSKSGKIEVGGQAKKNDSTPDDGVDVTPQRWVVVSEGQLQRLVGEGRVLH